MADEYEYYDAEAPDDEKLRIAQHFLLSSPPGQVHEVLRDVAKLVPPHVLTDGALRGALHAYNLKSFFTVDVPDADYKILICEDAQVDASHYIDPIGRRVLGFDHIKQQIIPDDIEDLPPVDNKDLESERAQLQKNLQSYIQFEYMHQGTAGVFSKGTTIVVNLCTERVNLRNFWSGRWKSHWVLDLTAQPMRVTGKMELHVHYFENGNLQLQCEKVVAEDARFDRANGLTDAVLKIIKEAEDELQSNLEDMYINMSQETFKEMRRVMPVTQTKMEWTVHAHRTARDLSRK